MCICTKRKGFHLLQVVFLHTMSPTPPTRPRKLRDHCVTRLLASLHACDEDSVQACKDILLAIGGIELVVRGAFGSPAALAGLERFGEWEIVDACRVYIAKTKRPLVFSFVVDCFKESVPDREVCLAVGRVCRAFLGNGRYKRDMKGPLLPTHTADTCRALRNIADRAAAKQETTTRFTRDGKRRTIVEHHWRYQDLRHHASAPNDIRRGPWFPGYEH